MKLFFSSILGSAMPAPQKHLIEKFNEYNPETRPVIICTTYLYKKLILIRKDIKIVRAKKKHYLLMKKLRSSCITGIVESCESSFCMNLL